MIMSTNATKWQSVLGLDHRLGFVLLPGIQPKVFYSVLFHYYSQSVLNGFYMFLSMNTVIATLSSQQWTSCEQDRLNMYNRIVFFFF